MQEISFDYNDDLNLEA